VRARRPRSARSHAALQEVGHERPGEVGVVRLEAVVARVADEQPAAAARDRFGGVDIIIHVNAAVRLRRAGSRSWTMPNRSAHLTWICSRPSVAPGGVH